MMGNNTNSQGKRRAILRLQLQGLLLISLVSVLLFLSFFDDQSTQSSQIPETAIHTSETQSVISMSKHQVTGGQAADDRADRAGSVRGISANRQGMPQTDQRVVSDSSSVKNAPSRASIQPNSKVGQDLISLEELPMGITSEVDGEFDSNRKTAVESEPIQDGISVDLLNSPVDLISDGHQSSLVGMQSTIPIREISDLDSVPANVNAEGKFRVTLGQRIRRLSVSEWGSLLEASPDSPLILLSPDRTPQQSNNPGIGGSASGAGLIDVTLEQLDRSLGSRVEELVDDSAADGLLVLSIRNNLSLQGFLELSEPASSETETRLALLEADAASESLRASDAKSLSGSLTTNPYFIEDETEEIFEAIVQPSALPDSSFLTAGDQPSSQIAMTQLQSPAPTNPLPNGAPPRSPGQAVGAGPQAVGEQSGGTGPSSGAAENASSESNDATAADSGNESAGDSDGESSAEGAPDPNAEGDSEKHMISELVGTGYGWFGQVFDSGFYVSNEFTFLAPKSVGTVRVGVTDMLDESTVTEDVESGLGFGNRLTLGVRGRNAGLKVQYWTFASDHVLGESWQAHRPIPRFITASSAALETVDLEITQQHCLFGCQWESSFGGRYAKYDGQDSASLVDQLHDSLELTAVARATRYLRGAGPTFGLSGRKNLRLGFGKNAGELLPEMDCDTCGLETCLGDCDSWRTSHPSFPWSLYWNGRIAWLWAEESSGTVTEANVNYDGGDGGASTARSRDKSLIFDDRDSSIFTLGFQVGLEYTRPVFSRSQLMGRVGFEYQHWDLGKNVAEAQSFAFLTDEANFGGRVDALASSNRNYLKLSGFTFLIGLNY
ncbi:hypothetical protein OAA27_00205 [bacterium]|nr:hypothetical protein [bacterium]